MPEYSPAMNVAANLKKWNNCMANALFWIYFCNAILLILHEMDSAYWQEWKLFKLPGGIAGFLLLHIPLLFLILYGLILVYEQRDSGLGISLVAATGGIFAFVIHTWFLKRGRPEFNSRFSKGLLAATMAVSLMLAAVSIFLVI
jgi:hypothetical protein